MDIRHVKQADIAEITRIWEQHHAHSFALPHRRNLITEAVIEADGKLIAYGQVRHVAEPILVLDLNARQRDKREALIYLMHEAFRGTHNAGLDRLFAFTRDPDFADLIVKHFKYERADLGEFLIREL